MNSLSLLKMVQQPCKWLQPHQNSTLGALLIVLIQKQSHKFILKRQV